MAEIRDIWLHANNIIRSARQIVNDDLRPLGLSSAEGNILLHLLTQGRELPQERLVDQLDVSKPAISRALDSLAAKGFVTREPDPSDRRSHRVRLTAKALEIGPQVEQVYNHVYTLALQGVSPDEFAQFIRLLARVSSNFAREQVLPSIKESHAA